MARSYRLISRIWIKNRCLIRAHIKKKSTQMNSKWIYKYASISLIVGPILEPYNMPGSGLSVYKVLMLVNILFFYHHRKDSLFIPKQYKRFLLYAFTIPTLNALLQNYTSHLLGSYLALFLFSADLILTAPFIDFRYFRKCYRIAGIATCVVFLAQEASYYILGHRFMFLIPFLDVHYAGFTTASFSEHMLSKLDRSCSCFLEPSHFAQFLLPLLALELGFLHEKRKDLGFYAIFFTLILVMIRSGVGLLVCAALWGFFILSSHHSWYTKYFIVVPVVFLMAFFFIRGYSGTEQGSQVFERASQLNTTDYSYISSGIIRIYRGYWVYGSLDATSQLVGVGVGGADDAIDRSQVAWMFKGGEHYLNNIQTLLIGYGIIGLFLFLLFLFRMTRNTPFWATISIVAFLTTSLMESFFCTSKMLLFLIVPYVLSLQLSRGKSVSPRPEKVVRSSIIAHT